MGNEIQVEVVYATVEEQVLLEVTVAAGSTIEDVIQQSGILVRFPEIDLTQQKVGIFSQVKALSDGVVAGDRVEIYRALTLDPKELRRQRAVAAGQVLRRKGANKKKTQ